MNYSHSLPVLEDEVKLILDALINTNEVKEITKLCKSLDKIAIYSLEEIKDYWLSVATKLEDTESISKKQEELHENLCAIAHELSAYLDKRKEKEKEHVKAELINKLRKEELQKEALKEIQENGFTTLDTEFQKIHWSQFASPCKKNPHSAMILLPEGMIEQMIGTKECLKGQGKGVMKNLEVTYDKEYVIEWLKVKVVSPLKELPLETIQSLIAEAYERLGN